MKYEKWLESFFPLDYAGESRRGLRDPLQLVKELGSPHTQFPTIHVAGTNGKGSVSSKIAEVLRLCGYQVGLFSSPHLFDYRERMTINGQLPSRDEVEQGLDRLCALAKQLEIPPKFFSFTLMLSLLLFAHHQVDVAVIEAGLGGRLDPTNIIDPLLTVITSVDLDHEALLGSTLDAIAREKGGIIKEGIPLVLGERARRAPILKRAKEKKAPLYLARGARDTEEENQEIARFAIKKVLASHFSLSAEGIEEGLKKRPKYRYEVRGDVIFDVAHNPLAFQKLFERLARDFPKRAIHLLFGMGFEKNLEACLSAILPHPTHTHPAHIHLLSSSHPSLLDASFLAKKLEQRGYRFFSEGVELEKVKREGAILVVAGSFYMMAEATDLIQASFLAHPLESKRC